MDELVFQIDIPLNNLQKANEIVDKIKESLKDINVKEKLFEKVQKKVNKEVKSEEKQEKKIGKGIKENISSTEKLRKAQEKVTKELNGQNKEMTKQNKFGQSAKKMGGFAKGIVGGMLGGVGISAILAIANSAMMAQQARAGREMTANSLGLDVETTRKMETLSKRKYGDESILLQAVSSFKNARESIESSGAFAMLGINKNNFRSNNLLDNVSQVLNQLSGEDFKGYENQYKRDALNEIFGGAIDFENLMKGNYSGLYTNVQTTVADNIEDVMAKIGEFVNQIKDKVVEITNYMATLVLQINEMMEKLNIKDTLKNINEKIESNPVLKVGKDIITSGGLINYGTKKAVGFLKERMTSGNDVIVNSHGRIVKLNEKDNIYATTKKLDLTEKKYDNKTQAEVKSVGKQVVEIIVKDTNMQRIGNAIVTVGY